MTSLAAELRPDEALEFLEGLRPHHGYPVIDDEEMLVGMVMRHEIEEWVGEGNTRTLGDLVEKQTVISVTSESPIREAARLMVRHDYQQLPVLSTKQKDRVLGILTLNDIARQQNAFDRQIDQ